MDEEKKEENAEISDASSHYKVGSLMPTNLSPAMVAALNNAILASTSNPIMWAVERQRQQWISVLEKTLQMTTAVLNDHLTRSFAALQSTFLLFEKYHYSIFDNLSQALKLLVTKIDKADRFYQQALFDARWFPHVIRTESTELFEDVAEVLCTTRSDSKNRTKRLDSVFFSFYNQRALNDLKRKWRSIEDLPSYIKKIATQAVNAYQRKEYALTLSAFCTLWEGIIAKKSGKEDDYKISRKTRDALVELNDENEIGEIVTRFCTECIFPDCHSIQDVKEDLPLRHAIVHSWYTKYPTRKTALNAILFTDFLFELDSKVTLLEESHG